MSIYKSFDIFSRALVKTKDHDPVYPFIKQYFKVKGITGLKNKAWFLFTYVNFYSLETAMKMTDEMPISHWNPDQFRELRESKELSKFGIERRASMRNIDNQIVMFDFIKKMIDEVMHSEPGGELPLGMNTPAKFRSTIQSYVPFYGAWSAYKLCELYSEVLDIKSLKLTDLGLTGRDPNRDDSPVGGLRWLYGREQKYKKEDFEAWEAFGGAASKLYGMDIANIETCLCKFHKLSTGKYYIGHDIHELCELRHHLGEYIFAKVMMPFAPVFWQDKSIVGVIKSDKKLYKESGKIANSFFGDGITPVDIKHLVEKYAV